MKKQMMTMFLLAVLVCLLSGQGLAAERLKSYFGGCETHRYTYRLYGLPGGSQWEFRVGTDDGNIDNYSFSHDDGLFSNFQAVIVQAGEEDAEDHNSTVLDLTQWNPETCENPHYTQIFPPDGKCPYYIKFTFTASGDASKRHIFFDHPGSPHPVGNTLIGPWEQSEAWHFGLGAGDNRAPGGPVYGPASARITFESELSGQQESAGNAAVAVVLQNPLPNGTYTVDYDIVGGTAEAGADYTLSAGTLTFNPGETSKTIDIVVIDDGVPEDDETIELALVGRGGADAIITGDSHTFVIEDSRPGVAFESAQSEQKEEFSPVLIPILLSEPLAEAVTFNWELVGGTAENGVDYMPMPTSGTLTFEAGQTSREITVGVIDDGIEEEPETVILKLTSHTPNVKFGIVNGHTHTIRDPFYLDLHVDLALNICNTLDPIPGTLKEGWTMFMAERWYDMYMHDAVWEGGEDGEAKPPTWTDGLGGTGVHVAIGCGGVGNGGFHVHGMCRQDLGGGACPNGSPSGEPIANGFYHNVDWGGENTGDIMMRINALPPGEYQMINYHNHWEPASQGSRNCLDKESSMPPMPLVTAMSLPVDGSQIGYDKWNFTPGTGTGVEVLEEAFNIKVTSVLSDDEVARSHIRFRTNGADVLVIIDGGDNSYPDPARPGREGSKGILNAFEIIADVPPPSVDSDGDGVVDRFDNCPTIPNPDQGPCDQGCQCPGDVNGDGQVDLEDLQTVAGILLDVGSPFIVPVEPGHCGNLNGDEQVDLDDLQTVAGMLLDAGSPFVVPCQ